MARAVRGALLALALVACGRARDEPVPRPAFGLTLDASLSFEPLREAWERRDVPPSELRPRLEHHIQRFPRDATVATIRLYLALLLMQEGNFYGADGQIALLAATPRALKPGPERDLFEIARAKSLRHRGDDEGALRVLQPLAGKVIDETTRGIFLEELSLAALGARDDYEAVAYMDAWLRGVSEDKREQTRAKITQALEKILPSVVEGVYRVMRTRGAQSGYGPEIQRLVAVRLASIAVTNNDANLARWLLDATPGGADALGESGPGVLELAASRRGLREVQGRTVGLLLPIRSGELRDQSAEVLRGVSWALELPRPYADRADAVRLVTRNDAAGGGNDGSELAMEELLGEGAAVVIAGLDGESADRALRWGEAHGLPVLLLHPPVKEPTPTGAGFVLGESRATQVSVLGRALAADGAAGAQLITSSEGTEAKGLEAALAQGGLSRARETVDCDVPPERPGLPRFPLEAWSKARTGAFVVAGPPECLADTLSELALAQKRRAAPWPAAVAFTLEAGVPETSRIARAFTVSSGILPVRSARAADVTDPEVGAFYNVFGQRPSWWSSLGRDAGILARQAVSALPPNTTADPSAVTQRHAIVAGALSRARAPLWSTEASGFGGGHVLPRTLRVTELR